MFEFFRYIEKESFLMPSQEELDKIREKVRKQISYETFREKAIAERKAHSEEAKVFYPTGGKEKVEVIEVLGEERIASLMEEEKLTYAELMEIVRGFGSNADMVFHLLLPRDLKEKMLRDRFFLECQSEEELT